MALPRKHLRAPTRCTPPRSRPQSVVRSPPLGACASYAATAASTCDATPGTLVAAPSLPSTRWRLEWAGGARNRFYIVASASALCLLCSGPLPAEQDPLHAAGLQKLARLASASLR